MKKILILLSLLLLLPLAHASLLDWEHQRPIIIWSNNLESLEDYQFNFTLNTRTLIKLQKLNKDCSDLRIYHNQERVPFYIDECNSPDSTIWIKPSKVRALGETKLIMYYGNINTTSVSSGDEVFEFFDDFSFFDKNKWKITGEPWIKDKRIVLENFEIISKQKFSKPMIIEYIINEPERITNSTAGLAFPNSTAASNFKIIRTILSDYQNLKAHIPSKLAKGSYTDMQGIKPYSDFYENTKVQLRLIDAQISYTDSQEDEGTLRLNVVIDDPFTISFFSDKELVEVDKIFIRKYLPTFYDINISLGEEKENINLKPYLKIIYPTEGEYSKQIPITFTAEARDPEEQELIYKWDFGDSTSSTEKEPIHSYKNSGKYIVNLIVRDGVNSARDSVTVNIVDEPFKVKIELIYRVLALIAGIIVGILIYAKFFKKTI